jgi:hypothetical protein
MYADRLPKLDARLTIFKSMRCVSFGLRQSQPVLDLLPICGTKVVYHAE